MNIDRDQQTGTVTLTPETPIESNILLDTPIHDLCDGHDVNVGETLVIAKTKWNGKSEFKREGKASFSST